MLRVFWKLSLILALVAGSAAMAKTRRIDDIKDHESKLVQILDGLAGKHARNPMYRCYQLGRLQAYSDTLSIKLATKRAQPSEANAEFITWGDATFREVNETLAGMTYDCDPEYAMQTRATPEGEPEILAQMSGIIKKLKRVEGEEIVVRCFHTGRLSLLNLRLHELLRDKKPIQLPKRMTDKLLKAAPKELAAKTHNCFS